MRLKLSQVPHQRKEGGEGQDAMMHDEKCLFTITVYEGLWKEEHEAACVSLSDVVM
jgi:hypothetical protein